MSSLGFWLSDSGSGRFTKNPQSFKVVFAQKTCLWPWLGLESSTIWSFALKDEFAQVDAAIAAVAAGKVVVVLDDEDRENEGDFICAASMCTPEIVNFMVANGRGMLCVPMLPERAQRLQLDPLPTNGPKAAFRTAFTVAVDHHSVRTGITVEERCRTVLALADPKCTGDDLVKPGHVNPIIAKEGGVLRRAGHTEATVDLMRLAGFEEPVGVLIEILNDEGDRATPEELRAVAEKYDLVMITIEQLIRYRRRSERLVRRSGEAELPTKRGTFSIVGYQVAYEDQEPIALVYGDLSQTDAPLVRLHSSCFTGDLIQSMRCDCGDQLNMALDMISEEGCGALVYLPQEGRGIGLLEKIKAYSLQDDGMDTVQANLALGYKADPRDYGVGIQILKDLGLSKVRLMTNNPKKTDAFIYGGFELQVVDQVPIAPKANEHNLSYLKTKRDKMGHRLPIDES